MCALAWAASGSPHDAHAQGGGVRLRIDCSPLDDAAYAALEARTRAELASVSTRSSGEVSITCSTRAAVLKWVPREGKWRQQSVPLAEDRSEAVEAILTALDALMFEAPTHGDGSDAGATSSPSVDTPSDEGAASPPPQSAAPAPSAPAAPPPPPPTASPPPPPAATAAPVAPAAVTDKAPAERPVWYGTALTLGADSELWSGGVAAAVGAHAGVRFSPSPRWSVAVAAGDLWATSTPQSVQSQTLRAFVGVDCDLPPAVRVGLAVDARMMLAQQGSSAASNAATAGLLLTARYVARLGSLELSAGPLGEVLFRPIIVQVSGAEVFRVPTALLGLSIDGTLGLGAAEASL